MSIPSSFPDALTLLRAKDKKIAELTAALAWDSLPAWVIADVLAENKRLRTYTPGKITNLVSEAIDTGVRLEQEGSIYVDLDSVFSQAKALDAELATLLFDNEPL